MFYMHTQLLCVDYESDFVVHMDPHCLIPCFMEDGMQLECVTLQNSIAVGKPDWPQVILSKMLM